MFGVVPIVVPIMYRGGGFGGTDLQFIVAITLIGALLGFLIGLIYAIIECEWKLLPIVTFCITCLMGLLGLGIVGIAKIVEMVG